MMKKIYLALMCMAAVTMFTACGGGSKKSADGTAETKTETKASNLDVGDRYAFAGLASADVVPPFAREISDVSDGEGNGITEADTFFGFGNDRDPFSDKKYNEFGQKLFARMKALSDDGKVYEVSGLFCDVGEEVAELPEMKKFDSDTYFSYGYLYQEKWIRVQVNFHKSFSGKTEGMWGLSVECKNFYLNKD